MRRATIKLWIAGGALAAILAGGSGCVWPTWAGNPLSFAVGVLFASQIQTSSTEYHCYRNGVEIDCSTLNTDQP